MNLYSLSIQETTGITHLAQGNLISSKSQDLVLVRGSETIELLTQLQETDQLELVLRNMTFSQIRNVMTYRPVGNLKDYLVICSDSGKLTIVEHVKDEFERSSFRVIVQETMCKSGCRRIAPGEFLAKDPKGRAIILASIEKNKLIYLTSKSSTSDDFVISSPLEANKANTLVLDMAGLNVGFENPLFVCLEIDYGEIDDPSAPVVTGEPRKMLTFYEIDLGLNHVIKKKSIEVDPESSMVLAIGENPNLQKGVLLVASRDILYFDLKGTKVNHIRVPQRFDLLRTEGMAEAQRLSQEESEKGLLFLSKAFCKYKNENFYLLQNEWGDIFQVAIRSGNQLALNYFCTSRVCIDMCIFKTGFLFLANEAAEHQLLAIHSLDPVEGLVQKIEREGGEPQEVYFPLPIKNSQMFIEMESLPNLAGLTNLKYEDLYGDDIGQIYALTCGVNGSKLTVMRHAVQTKGSVKLKVPFNPDSLFVLPLLSGQTNLKENLLIGFEKRTYMLKGEKDRVSQTPMMMGFISSTNTIYADVLDLWVGRDDQGEPKKTRAYLQVHGAGFRIIFRNNKFMDWTCEEQKHIIRATSVENQILINLSSQELIYFLFADNKLEEVARASLTTEIVCMTLFIKQNLRQHSTFAVLGLKDKSIRVFSLEKDFCLMKMSSQFLPAVPENIVIQHSHVLTALSNGVLCRTHIDELTGALSEARTRVMTDGQPLKMFPVTVGNTKAVVLSGNKHYLGYFDRNSGKFELQHLIIDNTRETSPETLTDLKFVIDYHIDLIMIMDVNGLIKICKVSIPKTGFTSKTRNLELTGRRLLINSEHQNLIIVQTQNRVISRQSKQIMATQLCTSLGLDQSELPPLDAELLHFGVKASSWESKISVVNPITLQEIFNVRLAPDEHILETQLLNFKGADNESFLLVSVATHHDVLANQFRSARVDLYIFENDGKGLSLFHSTVTDGLVTAVAGFKGRLLMGVNGFLRTYELGIKQLLKKGEYKHQYGVITSIRVSNDRVYMGDSRNSVHLLRYKDGEFTELADDVLPRFLTGFDLLDHHTVALIDKFGNFSVLRIPPDSEQELSEDFMTYKFKWENGYLNGAPVKFDQLCSYYYQVLQTSIQKVTFNSSQEDALLLADIHGAIRLLVPFEFKADLDFFKHLELYLRLPQDGYPFLTDRDHLLFRSYHSSSRGVIDGDLCEQFIDLNENNQALIAQNLDRTKGEIIKKLEDFRFKII